jgi:hypothetical protein
LIFKTSAQGLSPGRKTFMRPPTLGANGGVSLCCVGFCGGGVFHIRLILVSRGRGRDDEPDFGEGGQKFLHPHHTPCGVADVTFIHNHYGSFGRVNFVATNNLGASAIFTTNNYPITHVIIPRYSDGLGPCISVTRASTCSRVISGAQSIIWP